MGRGTRNHRLVAGAAGKAGAGGMTSHGNGMGAGGMKEDKEPRHDLEVLRDSNSDWTNPPARPLRRRQHCGDVCA